MGKEANISGSYAGDVSLQDFVRQLDRDGDDIRAMSEFDEIFEDSVSGHGGHRLVVLHPLVCANFDDAVSAFLCAVEISVRFARTCEQYGGLHLIDLRMLVSETGLGPFDSLPKPAMPRSFLILKSMRGELLKFLHYSRADKTFGEDTVSSIELFRSLRAAEEILPNILEFSLLKRESGRCRDIDKL